MVHTVKLDLIFEPSWRDDEKYADFIDMVLTRNNHTNAWSNMTRPELLFVQERLAAYLEDTEADNNFVYRMKCGHEYDSPYRLSASSRTVCSAHGFQWIDPEFGEVLPDYAPPRPTKRPRPRRPRS